MKPAPPTPSPLQYALSAAWQRGALGLLVLLCACGKAAEGTPQLDHPAELARMHAACVEAMVKSSCQVMTGPEAASTAEVVFVAGVGPVDAKAYRELRASGDAMCGVVQKACQNDWDGGQCRTARGLWPPPASGKPTR